MKTLITLLLFAIVCCLHSQINCDKILNKPPYITRIKGGNLIKDSVFYDVKTLARCGNLNTIDSFLISSHLPYTLVKLSKSKGITYKTILIEFENYKKTDEYKDLYVTTETTLILEKKVVDEKEWEKDKILLEKLGFRPEDTEKLKTFLKRYESEKITYGQAVRWFEAYSDSLAAANVVKGVDWPDLISLDNAAKISKENNKLTLIYFSGYAVVNAVKMNEGVLKDKGVVEMITNQFSNFIAFTDDGNLSEDGKTTIGKKYLNLLKEQFNYDLLPYFVILDVEGKVKATSGYVKEPTEFIEFLFKGLN